MEYKIGKYIVHQRTDFSIFKLLDAATRENITRGNEEILERILKEHDLQNKKPDDYYKINFDKIVGITNLANSLDNLFIPEGVESIEMTSFEKMDFYRVSFPASINTIESRVFSTCCFLEEIELPDSIDRMGAAIFEKCSNLKSAKLPNTLQKIPNGTFARCTLLKDITIPETVTKIGRHAFAGCTSLTDIIIPDNVKILDEDAFNDCANLKNIRLSDELEEVEDYCFEKCTSLEEITLPDTILYLGTRAFADCANLKFIKLPDKITFLHDELFSGCKSLKTVTLPDDIETIGMRIFANAPQLKNINIPKALKNADTEPFKFSGIKSLTFNHNLHKLNTNIGDLITGSKIDTLIIKNNVKKITSDAFFESGEKIKTINYIGTEKEFIKFKKNNKALFDVLPNIKKINFVKSLEDIEKQKSTKSKNIEDELLF